MMDTPSANSYLAEGLLQEGDEIGRIYLSGNYFDNENVMDSGELELDQMLNQEGGFNLNESDLDEMMHTDNLSLGSNDFQDQLASMPIVEVNDEAVENLLESIAKEENIPVPVRPYLQQRMMSGHEDIPDDAQPDPLLGSLKRGGGANANPSIPWTPSNPLNRRSSFHMKDITQEVDALQRLVDSSLASSKSTGRLDEVRQAEGQLEMLEREKLKLLSRLNEINQRQSGMSMSKSLTSNPQRFPSNMASVNAVGGMASLGGVHGMASMGVHSRISGLMGIQQQQMPVSSAGGMGSGETPLTSFLRKNQKGQEPVAGTGISALARNNPGAPHAASIFSETQWTNQNTYAQDGDQSNQPFYGAMENTTMSQNLIQTMAAQSRLARSNAGAHIHSGVLPRVGKTGNASWGDGPGSKPSFQASGILAKHISDNNLARSGVRSGLIKNQSKNSMSREHLRGFMRAHSKPSDDSLSGNNNLPFKRRQGAGPKYKVGHSRSVPHLLIPSSGSRGDLSQSGTSYDNGGPQSNAAW